MLAMGGEDDDCADSPLGFVVGEYEGRVFAYVVAESEGDLTVMRFDEGDVDPTWEAPFEDEEFVDIVLQPVPGEGCPGVLVVGTGGGDGFHLTSYTYSGVTRWDTLYDPDELDILPAAAACNDEGEVFVTGTRTDAGDDILTVRFEAATGECVWSAVYDRSGYDDTPADIVAEVAHRSVVVTSASEYNDIDVVTICYAQDNPDQCDVEVSYVLYGDIEPVEMALCGGTSSPSVAIACRSITSSETLMTVLRYAISGVDLLERPESNVRVHGSQAGPRGIAADLRGYCYVAVADSSANTNYDILSLGYTQVGTQAGNWRYDVGIAYAADAAVYYSPGAGGDSVVAVVGSKDDDALTLLYDMVRPAGWGEVEQVPFAPSNKYVKDGGWLEFNRADGLVYAAKGNKVGDFYRYDPAADTWTYPYWPRGLAPIPKGTDSKWPSRGCVGCADGDGRIYMTKGNNTCGFWIYDVEANAWAQKKDVPLGLSNKKVKGGTDMVHATDGLVYLLKGYKNEFYRYHADGDSWHTLAPAPVGNNQKWDKGSWLAYDDVANRIYAHKARYHEFYSYDVNTGVWSAPLTAMPVPGTNGNKKSKDGGCGTWLNGRIYALKGGNTQEFWRYSASADAWDELDTIPQIGGDGKKKKVKAGGGITCADGVFFALKGNKSNQCWAYYLAGGASADGVCRSSPGGGGQDPGGETPIADGLDASKPRWHPSGLLCCYSREDTTTEAGWEQIFQAVYGGAGGEWQTTFDSTHHSSPSYSPDGTYIVMEFDDPVSGCVQIGRVPAFGGTGLGDQGQGSTNDKAPIGSNEQAPAAAPMAMLESNDGAADEEVLGSPPTFTQVTQLTFGGTQDRESPEVDPFGRLVCYVMDTESGDNCYSQIWCVPANGGPEEQLSFEPGDHYDPVWASPTEIVYTYSPDKGYDMTCLLDIATGQEKPLTTIQTDHDNADVVAFDSLVVQEALDDAGNSQLTRVYLTGGLEAWLTSGQSDIMEPDYCQDELSVFAVRWTGITSQIVCVDALQGGYYSVTDTCAIRDNPDGFARGPGTTSYVVYEREAWEPLDLLLGGKRRPGTGIYASRFRRPHDGGMGASLYAFALDRARPNPARDRLSIAWQVPVLSDVSLKVYNTAGQLVKVLASGKTKPGAYTTVWNGTDTKGRRLASGIYFVSLDNGSKRISRKVVLTE